MNNVFNYWQTLTFQGGYLMVAIALGVVSYFLEKVQRETGRKEFGLLSWGFGLLCLAEILWAVNQVATFWYSPLPLCDDVGGWVQAAGYLLVAF